jgi:hypothetical protein
MIIDNIIKNTDNLVAIESFYHSFNKDDYKSLAANKNISTDLWYKLANKANIDVAYNLYCRELNQSQIEFALKDKRKNARRAMLIMGLSKADPNFIDKIIDENYFDSNEIAIWLYHKTGLSSHNIRTLANKVGGVNRIRVLQNKEAFPDIEEVVNYLLNENINLNGWDLNNLFRYRPELNKYIKKFKKYNIRSAFANSWNLTSLEDQLFIMNGKSISGNINVWISLLGNPYTKKEVIELMKPAIIKDGNRSDLYRSLNKWDLAPGKPLNKPLDKITSSIDKERAEYFSVFNSSYYSELPWTDKKEYSANLKNLSLEDINNLNEGYSSTIFSTNWQDIAKKLDEILKDSPSYWSNFWSLISNWNGNLRELAAASTKL